MIVPTVAFRGSCESLLFPFVLGGLGDSPSRRGQILGPLFFLSWVTPTWLGIPFQSCFAHPPPVYLPFESRVFIDIESGYLKGCGNYFISGAIFVAVAQSNPYIFTNRLESENSIKPWQHTTMTTLSSALAGMQHCMSCYNHAFPSFLYAHFLMWVRFGHGAVEECVRRVSPRHTLEPPARLLLLVSAYLYS